MKKNLINTFIKNNTINPKILIILNLISAILIITLISIHPFVGDDYLYKEMVIEFNANFINYFTARYNDWSGRIFQNFITYFIYSNYLLLNFYKLLIYPSYILVCYLIFFKITNYSGKKSYTEFLIFLTLFWFILPVPAETIVWVIGTTVYIYPFYLASYF